MVQHMLRPLAHAVRSVVGTNGLSERVARLEEAVLQPRPAAAEAPAASLAPPPVTPPSAGVAPEPAALPLDFNLLLHQSRGALLRGMPAGARRLLSAGCAGLWYFEWIEQTYGRVPEHLGIEYYSPRPEALPDNVRWIANTASDMSDVETGSCDLVMSGQNLEHLWPEEVAGFLLEAARVLRAGGHLVVDSPNRIITAPLNWSHPEHTIELTADEISMLLPLAGFDVTAMRGIWLCREPRTGAILPFDPSVPVPGWSVVERLAMAADRPADSFLWWAEAVRTDREPDEEAVHAAMAELFRQHWPERVQRLIVPAGRETHVAADGRTWVDCKAGQGGTVLFGPYMPLRAGRYRVSWQVRPAEDARSAAAVCEVVAGPAAELLARHEVMPGESEVSAEFALADTTFGLQFRCTSTGGEAFSVLRSVVLEPVQV